MKKIMSILFISVLILLVTGCGVTDEEFKDQSFSNQDCNDEKTELTQQVTQTEALPENGKYSAEQIFEKYCRSTVHIESSNGGGSGFFIKNNVIATNNHVISGAEWLTVKTVDGQIYDAVSVLAFSEQPDLALIKIDGEGVPLKMNSHGISEGENIYCIGAPMGIFPCISDGIVMKSSHTDMDIEYILSNFHAIGGNSGGPVLNAYGELIGVVVGGMMDGPNSIDMIIHGKYLETLDMSNEITLGTKEEWEAEFNKPEHEKYEIAELQDAKVGQLVKFGNYEQDGNEANGKEEILWIVKERNADTLKLMSLYCLDAIPYNHDNVDTTWETSYAREFLNNDFYNNAFSSEEKNHIIESDVINSDNPVHGTPGGNDTVDKVYLPSLEEVMEYYGISEPIETFYDHVYAQATEYTMKKGVWLEIEGSNRCWWWLRSSGGNPQNAAEVGSMGYLSFNGTDITCSERAIRPVLELNIK